MTVEYHIREL
jgi:hypothetical protein